MGNAASAPDEAAARDRQRQRRRAAALLADRGVLLPPSFLLDQSLSVQDRLPRAPSLVDDLRARDPSRRLLTDFLRPGLWVAARDPRTGARVAAAVPLGGTDEGAATPATGSPLLLMEREGAGHALQLRVGGGGTDTNLLPTLAGRYDLYTSRSGATRCTLLGQVLPYGQGWSGVHLEHTVVDPSSVRERSDHGGDCDAGDDAGNPRDLHLTLGGVLKASLVRSNAAVGQCPFHSAPVAADQARGYAAVRWLGVTAAVEARLPLHPHQEPRRPETRTYLHIDLGGDVDSGGDAHEDAGPPLAISLEQTPQGHALAVSQTLAFDRYQLNPLEDRAPCVRNALAWTVRLEQGAAATPSAVRGGAAPTPGAAPPAPPPRLALGAAWQANRALGFKAVLPDAARPLGGGDNGGPTLAVVVRRWREPRLTGSLLLRPLAGSSGSSSGGGSALAGIALELETGQLRGAAYAPVRATVGGGAVPETRAAVPKPPPPPPVRYGPPTVPPR